jgi:hypothetical protein
MRALKRALALTSLLPAAAVLGHHSAGALYLVNETIEIEGIVTEFRFVNPHVRLYVDVGDPSGRADIWLAEGQSKNVLIREGWTGQELRPGDRVILTGNPPRDGSHSIQWSTIRTAGGAMLGGGTEKDFSAFVEARRSPNASRRPISPEGPD